MTKHRGEKRRKGQFFSKNASAFKIHRGEKAKNGAMA
jgi:hypothetical protein